jgi:capsular polysaccharide biosynthesis protein
MNSSLSQLKNLEKNRAKDINLKELFLVIKRRIWVIVIFMLLGGTVGILQSMKPIVPLYQTSSRVIIGADEASIKTLQVIVKDSTVLDKVVKELNLKETSDVLAGKINVSSIDGSQVVSISVVDSNPVLAAKIANTTAQIFKDEVPNIVGKDYVRFLSKAEVNSAPINPKSHKKLPYYFIFGLVVGIGFGFLLESLDDTVRSERELEPILGVPVLAKISKMTNKNIKKKKQKYPNLENKGETIGYE